MNDTRARFFTISIGTIVVLSVLISGTAWSVTYLVCGASFTDAGLFAGVAFLFTLDTTVFGPVTRDNGTLCAVPGTAIGAALGALLLLFVLLGIILFLWWRAWQESDLYYRRDLLNRPGFAMPRELRRHLGAKAVLRRGVNVRPSLPSPKVTDVGWKVGESRGIPVYVSCEDSICLEGAPRSGKGFRIIISAIIDWSGPLITTSTRNDNLAATMKMLARHGTVTVFDPQRLSGVRSTLRISPVTGCGNPLTAVQRAQSIVAGSPMGQSDSNQEWAGKAATIIAQLLHAAAISGEGTKALRDWGASPVLARRAIAILRADGSPGWADALGVVVNGDDKLLANSWFGVTSALAPLQIPDILEAMTPTWGEEFDVDQFLAARNTLYLLGTGAGAGAVGGFLGAILDDIVETARRKALASTGSRLDPPLGLVLDEIANMFAWPALPTILADGGGIGISTMVVLQSLSQAETAWSSGQADTIWSSSIVKILLGGAGNVSHLRDISDLVGQHRVKVTSRSFADSGNSTSEQQQTEAIISVDELRRLPEGLGLLSYRNRRPVLLDLNGWIHRDDAPLITAGKKTTETEQLIVFAEQLATRTIRTPAGTGAGPDV
jgi:type IV secretion system protein VirD4